MEESLLSCLGKFRSYACKLKFPDLVENAKNREPVKYLNNFPQMEHSIGVLSS